MKNIKNIKPQLSKNLFPVVGVGASAGGLQAFTKFIKGIPDNAGMAYVLVQHLAPSHQSLLPELLQKITDIPVIQISDDIEVEPNHIYIIPSNKIMKATDGVLKLSPRPAKDQNERNLPIDLFFTSLAEVHQAHAIGVVLSGTASDGTQGLKAIKDHGGLTFAQDEESAQYDGMPSSAAQAGVVDFILPPEEIPKKILEITTQISKSDGEQQNIPPEDGDAFHQILSLLRIRKGTDFSYYKKTTIHRRILRRMTINKFEKLPAYLQYLRENKPEQDILYQDLLIPVTGFFRDPKVFDNLCSNIFPQITKNKKPLEAVRIWIAGCSTGEEAYSVAMCLKEFLGENPTVNSTDKVQIFATDISEPAITKARLGIYAKNEIENISPERLREFFTKTNGGYQVNKDIRNMCVFALHNFLKDPPFSKMDFISCRNVLIYMEPYLQKKAFTTFHYALNPKGFLLLGKSETISGVPELFGNIDKQEKLFCRKDRPSNYIHKAAPNELSFAAMNQNTKTETARTDFQKTADEVLLKKYTPPGVIVNEALDIVQFRGSTGAYLEPSPGKPNYNLLTMAKPGLSFELRNILHKAKMENAPVVKDDIPLQVNGQPAKITIEAMPLPNMAEPHFLVLFHEEDESRKKKVAGSKRKVESSKKKVTGSEKQEEPDQNELRIQQLEQELAVTREDMRGITEEQEAANEELQSANEELLSSSEELQSLNEELETTTEELQSTNEELTVVNQELVNMNEQISEARNYAESVIATIWEPLLVLDKNLRIKTANRSFYKTFNVDEQATENKLIFEIDDGQWNNPDLRTLLEKILPEKTKFSNFEVKYKSKGTEDRVMMLNAREIKNNTNEKLILLAIDDVSAERLSANNLKESENRYSQLLQSLPVAIYTCDADEYVNYYNDAALKMWGRTPELGKDRWCGSWKIFRMDGVELPLSECPMANVLKGEKYDSNEALIIMQPDGTKLYGIVYPRAIFDLNGKITGAINTIVNVTTQIKAQQESEQLQQQKDDFLGIASHELKTPLTVIKTYAQILEKLLTDKGSTQEAAMATKMNVQLDRMNGLIIDLLDTTKINSGKLQFNDGNFNFDQMVKSVLEDMKFTTNSHQVIQELNAAGSIVYADWERIEQVLDNFITNAVKYSSKADKIVVRTEMKDKQVVLSVQDFGIGIDAEKKDKVFEQFYRVTGKGEPNTYPGIGLGLFIAAEIVRRENGRVWVESEEGKGSVFYFSLPCL
ncbi:MAG TPA: chemotaxis protein CheB [Hanamia sp.]